MKSCDTTQSANSSERRGEVKLQWKICSGVGCLSFVCRRVVGAGCWPTRVRCGCSSLAPLPSPCAALAHLGMQSIRRKLSRFLGLCCLWWLSVETPDFHSPISGGCWSSKRVHDGEERS